MRVSRLLTVLICTAVMTGCMVGPNFHSPARPKVKAYTEKPMPAKTVATKGAGKAGKAQYFANGEDIPGQWWHLFHSQDLNNLITAGLAKNPTLSASYASLRIAQENLNAQIGSSFFPAFGANASAQRQKFSDATLGRNNPSSIFNLFNVTVNVSYTLDVFGGLRRQAEGFYAQVDYQQFLLMGTYLTLTSNIVTTAVTAASYQEQIQTTRDLIKSQEHTLDILEKQFDLGAISNASVLTQQTLVNQTRATLPPLEKSLAQSRHALAVLTGCLPSSPLPDIHLDDLVLPEKLPVSLPSNLVRQRPDVRASEALLHVASTNIGVATANLLPQFAITNGSSNYGWADLFPSELFRPRSNIWSLTGSVTQPLFQGGALLAKRQAAIDSYQQAAAQYRQTVLTAFQNVADTLRALDEDAKTLHAQKRAELSAKKNLDLAQDQYRLGGADYLSLLNAQQQYQQVRLAVIQAKATRYNDTAALFQALGGGWWNRPWCVKECV